MFGWLAKMLVESPIQGSSCSCCASKKKQLEEMQQALEHGDIPTLDENVNSTQIPLNFSSGRFSAQYDSVGNCRCKEYTSKILGELDNNYPHIVDEDDSSEHNCGCNGGCGRPK